MISKNFIIELEKYAAISYSRQMALAKFLGEGNWTLNIEKGVVIFRDDQSFPVQLLGTESTKDKIWMWSWGNPQFEKRKKLLVGAKKILQHGMRIDAPELTTDCWKMDKSNGHILSLFATGFLGKYCYYRAPFESGSLYFLIEGLPKSIFLPSDPNIVVSVITSISTRLTLNHRSMCRFFLKNQKYSVVEESNKMIAKNRIGQIEIVFDNDNRITEIDPQVYQ